MEGITNADLLEERYNDAFDEIAKMKELLGSESDEDEDEDDEGEIEASKTETDCANVDGADSFEAGGGQLGEAEADEEEEDDDYLFRRPAESEQPAAPTQPHFYADLEEEEDADYGDLTTEDRLMQEGEARANRLERQRQDEFMREQESNSALEINAVSRELQSKMVREGDINDQLMQKKDETQRRVRELQMKQEQVQMAEVTLTPKINAHSRDLMAQGG
jgi:hypothetical protein